jgi:hypothetical protein
MIKKGMKIRIKSNLEEEMKKLNVHYMTAKIIHNKFSGTEQIVHEISFDKTFVTIDICLEIPIQCCEII